ncbi:hypothetical protein FB451DRAFT_1412416 [Mycena latifolia]|nr:hypothetical protein FB451DRAFT_1412416 [Mycena latifolia]
MTDPISPFGVFPSIPPRGTGSSPPMPSCPADLTVASLTTASGSQLDFWIDAANKKAEKKVLVKTGRVDARRERLAGYYGLDLSVMPVAPTIGPVRPPGHYLSTWSAIE